MPLARVSGSRNRLTPLRTVFVTDSPYARRALIHHRLICAVAVAVGVGTGKSGAESKQMEAIVNNFHFSIFCFSILSFAFYLRLRHIPSYTLSFVCSFHSLTPLFLPLHSLSPWHFVKQKQIPRCKCLHSSLRFAWLVARGVSSSLIGPWLRWASTCSPRGPNDALQTGSCACVWWS